MKQSSKFFAFLRLQKGCSMVLRHKRGAHMARRARRMYSLLVIALLFTLLLPTTLTVRAQSDKTAGRNQEQLQRAATLRQEIQQRIENVQTRRGNATTQLELTQLRMATRSAQVAQDRGTRLSERSDEYGDKLRQRFTLYNTRLMILIDKLQSRLEKLENEGKDVSSSKEQLTEIREQLEQARTESSQAVSSFQAIEPGEISVQRVQIETARDQASVARHTYVEIIQSLSAVVKEVKSSQ